MPEKKFGPYFWAVFVPSLALWFLGAMVSSPYVSTRAFVAILLSGTAVIPLAVLCGYLDRKRMTQ